MFLKNTLHIFLIYVAIALVFCIPPFTKSWENLVRYLNKRKINGLRIYKISLFLSPILLIVSILITHLFQFYKGLKVDFWLFFVPAGFIIIPFTSSYYGILAFLKREKHVGLADLFCLLFFYGGFAGAGTNIHDVLWCARRTVFYTKEALGGNDLKPWVEVLKAGSYDYRIFGFYMLIQVIVFLLIAHSVFSGFRRINKVKSLSSLKLKWLALLFLAGAITLIDWPDIIKLEIFHTVVISIFTLISCIIFYKSGIVLSDAKSKCSKTL